MFLVVGEFIKQDSRIWNRITGFEKQDSRIYKGLQDIKQGDRINVGLQDRNIVKEFWKFMEEKGCIHIIDLEGVRNDMEGCKKLNLNEEKNIICDCKKDNLGLCNDNYEKITYIISRGAHFKYTKEVLEKFPNLKYILLAQIGNDNVDLKYCKQKGIEVVNFVSQKSIYSVAEQTVASLIGGIRQFFTTGCNLKNGKYSRKPIGKNLEDVTIGVMGCGRIGQKVIELLQVFPCKVVTYDIIFGLDKKENWVKDLESNLCSQGVKTFSDLASFLKESDYISVHIPGFRENLGLLNYSKLKNVGGVVNMARAGIVVEEDILKLLDEGKVEFYVSDVVEGEPYIEKINQKLINHPKVFITPHIGANTYQVQVDILEKLLNFLKGQKF